MAGSNINVQGLEALMGRLKTAPGKIIKKVDEVMGLSAKTFVAKAKRDSPKDIGFLAGEITQQRLGQLNWAMVSGSRYAGYLEFGTKKRFKPIPGFEKEAAALKGLPSGSAEEAIQNIMQWVKRKGIRLESASKYKTGKKAGQNKKFDPETTARYIFHFIMINGIKPQPYFFKHVAAISPQLEKDLRQITDEIFD